MNAEQLRRLVANIRAKHRPSHGQSCEACVLLMAIDTAVARAWDPVSGGPIRGASRE